MVHLWIRAESCLNEERAGITPDGAAQLIAQGFTVTVEDSPARIFPIAGYAEAGALIAAEGSWPDAPHQAVILGLGALPQGTAPLPHRHIMFADAFSGHPAGQALLDRLAKAGGQLYDLAELTDPDGQRLADFDYWAGFAGAAVALLAWASQLHGHACPPLGTWPSRHDMIAFLRARLDATQAPRPRALLAGGAGRMGRGVLDLCHDLGLRVTVWEAEAIPPHAPSPEVLTHGLLLNCLPPTPGGSVLLASGRFPRRAPCG